MKRVVVVSVAVITVCLGVVVSRAMWEGRSDLASGDSAYGRGDRQEAVRRWRRAARWYIPGAGHVGDAYDRLERAATAAEADGDTELALMAWRAIRRSALATRSLFQPYGDRLKRANEHIASLMAAGEDATGGEQSRADREAFHRELLGRPVGPSVGWSVIAIIGLAMWLLGALAFAIRGLDGEGRLVVRPAGWCAAAVMVGLVIWMIGLYKA